VNIAALVNELRPRLTDALIAVDFDGTLAPIVADPSDARPAPGAVDALRELSGNGARIAVITGRDARTAVELGGLDTIAGVIVEGLYGAEQWRDGSLRTLPEAPALQELRAELPRLVDRGDPALWVEDKRLSLVVHGRLAADPEAALDPLRARVAALGERLGLDVHPGRGVIELRLPGYDKGSALLRLVDDLGPRAVLFVGDDVGDLPAFEAVAAVRRRGLPAWSVAAVAPEVPEVAAAADVRVDGPTGVVELLAALSR
jgi:trehalose 6-phosphate phosphatase